VSAEGRIGLGHRQLSSERISPTETQPVSSEDGTLWISLYGEIYNRADVCSELKKQNGPCGAPDLSDAQVVLQTFRIWGIRCVDRFNGMFAFGLWDSRAGQLWLVRDHLGLKPLYYSRIT
jgi:asparagine synthase (glutamine-hydrolysing)